MPLRILLVEDEEDLATAIQAVLQRQGHVVDHCADGLAGWTLLSGELARYDLAIVDWMLPGLTGPELCRRARGSGLTLPLLLLTARAQTSDRVEGLDAGADDYLSKPFAIEELLARLRALQRRHPGYREPLLEAGRYRLDPAKGQLLVSTSIGVVSVDLSVKEQQLMAYFLEHPDQIIPGSRLRNQLWDLHQDPVSNVVAAQVRLLRRKLAGQGLPSPIETVPSKGYRFHPQLPPEA
ncbi:response regulator transcription factor [Cyanobium sp. Maggiore-St4-Cus]|jgi:two-component system Ni(II)/redox-responsive regulator NrsR|nr:response regulator transcription factor [Cyanobium sp. Maggiore-St4-Cus]MCP9878119.1 response regulator transcription factor [Cyanobium sp. A2C-AMD]MCP9880311.1 response regulator transcription factor [Cyanobium sp. A1C-AMD]